MTPEQFRADLEAWLAKEIGASPGAGFDDASKKRIQKAMYDAGFLGITWPTVYGGRGLGPEYQTIFNEATVPYAASLVNSTVTVGICAAVLLDYASEEQKHRHIPRMLRGDEDWSQLLSEPDAGSDLGGVITRAVRDGDEWVVTGQKVWTSKAIECDFALALVRTDFGAPKYRGLSMIILDLKAEGVDIRPLRQMTGDATFNEVFLDGVRAPLDALVGAENDGWAVVNGMLRHERMALSAGTVGAGMVEDAFVRLLNEARERGVVRDGEVRSALAEVYLQRKLMDYMGSRMRAAEALGLTMGPVGSLGKIAVARSARLIAETGMLIGGNAAQAWLAGDDTSQDLAIGLLTFPKMGIAGGTTEIQKNVIAERVLCLPREERPDRDLPFRASVGSTGDPSLPR